MSSLASRNPIDCSSTMFRPAIKVSFKIRLRRPSYQTISASSHPFLAKPDGQPSWMVDRRDESTGGGRSLSRRQYLIRDLGPPTDSDTRQRLRARRGENKLAVGRRPSGQCSSPFPPLSLSLSASVHFPRVQEDIWTESQRTMMTLLFSL